MEFVGDFKPGSRLRCSMALAISFLIYFVIYTMNTIGLNLFFFPVSIDLGISTATLSLYITIVNICNAIAGPLFGVILQRSRINPRIVVSVCGIAFCAGYVTYGMCTSLWQFYLISAVRGIFMPGISSVVAAMLLSQWFKEKLPFVSSLSFSGSSFGGIFFSQVAIRLLEQYGWRYTYFIIGVASAIIILLIVAAYGTFPKREPAQNTYGQEAEEAGYMLEEVVRTVWFWIICAGFALYGFTALGVHQHVVSGILAAGHSNATSANVYSIYMAGMLAGKFLYGWIMSRNYVQTGIIYVGLFMALGSGGLIFASNKIIAMICAAIFGMGNVVPTMLVLHLPLTVYGKRDYGTIYSFLYAFILGGGIIGTTLSARIYDITGAYAYAWMFSVAIVILGMVLLLLSVRFALRDPAGHKS